MDTRRKIFISYAREDKKFASRLAEDLRKHIADIWIDEKNIEVGEPWPEKIKETIRQHTEFIVIKSPASLASEEVKNEVYFAKHYGLKIRPVQYKECEPWDQIPRINHLDYRTEKYAGVLKKLLEPPSPFPTVRRTWIHLKYYGPFIFALALLSGLAAAIYFLSPSNTSFDVSDADQYSIGVNVRNHGGRPSMLIGSSFRLHFDGLPIETERLVLLNPATQSQIAGHAAVKIQLTADGMLAPTKKDEDSYFTRNEIRPLLAGAKLTLTGEVKESGDRIKTRSKEFAAERISGFILEEIPNEVP